MGVLRSDRVSGLGGANAINGSAHFQGGDGNVGTAWNRYIDAGVSEDYNFGTGDFTVECWINRKVVTNDDTIWATTLAEASTGFMWYFDSSGNLRAYVGGSQKSSSSNSISAGTWYHVAITRASGTMQMWVDGVSKYSATVSGNVGSSTQNFLIGEANLSYGSNAYHFLGHISNLRIQKGKAEYTAAFTVPTTRLAVTPETVLLACHDPGNVLAEATGKTLTLVRSAGLTMSAGIVASRFVPDVGEDHGTTFTDNTKFDTLSYMVPPGGTAAQRGRGTALYGGGYKTPNSITAIDYLSIQSGGLTQEWGNLSTTALASGAALGSYTRWVTAGGWTGANNNAIEYVTFTTQGNSLEFGDLVVGRRNTSSVSNSTRGIWGGGYISPADAGTDSMDYVTIASTGNATDFGNLSGAAKSGTATGSTTRAVFALGNVAPADVDTLAYVTIATTGNATDFGNLTSARSSPGSCSSNVRGIYSGGGYPTSVNTIDYITIASTGDATDFGDLFLARGQMGGTSNGTRGVFMGGTTNPARQDTIDSVIIASTGNAVNWGDFRTAKQGLNSAASDSHGGLS